MVKDTNIIFKALRIIVWIIFISLCIEAGAILVNFIYSIVKPGVVKNLYNKLDLSELHNSNPSSYFCLYSFVIAVNILKIFMFYKVIQLMQSLNIVKPFSAKVGEYITQISFITFATGLFIYVSKKVAEKLVQNSFELISLQSFLSDSKGFILMSAVVFVIATIFNKGIELQNENDLTV
jgi:hypothetical protein